MLRLDAATVRSSLPLERFDDVAGNVSDKKVEHEGLLSFDSVSVNGPCRRNPPLPCTGRACVRRHVVSALGLNARWPKAGWGRSHTAASRRWSGMRPGDR
jgi:hypothetical protein